MSKDSQNGLNDLFKKLFSNKEVKIDSKKLNKEDKEVVKPLYAGEGYSLYKQDGPDTSLPEGVEVRDDEKVMFLKCAGPIKFKDAERFWVSNENLSLLLVKDYDDSPLKITVRLRPTEDPNECVGPADGVLINPDYTSMPDQEECMKIAVQFMSIPFDVFKKRIIKNCKNNKPEPFDFNHKGYVDKADIDTSNDNNDNDDGTGFDGFLSRFKR